MILCLTRSISLTDVPKDSASLEDPVYSDACAVERVTVSEILAAIRKLKPKLTSGTDHVPNFIVKGCSNLFAPILEHIFNISLSKGIFPSLWKESIVVPIHKTGDTSQVGNYRPVSLLCSFSKVF